MNRGLQAFDEDYYFKTVSELVNQWFKFSDEKQTYMKLLKKLDIDK